MENYKEKYEQALERATQKWECGDMTRESLEYLFPELAESEDEKISKEIVDFICWETDNGSITKEHLEKTNSWLAWLEKQGE